MSLPLPAAVRAVTALLWVAVALSGPGCRRMVKPDAGEDRTVEAGLPVGFGSEAPDAAEVTWDFGDGTPAQRGTRLAHAFPRAGTYTVRALDRDEVLASARVTVVPRAVLRAIPEDVEAAVFFPQVRGNVAPMLDFASRMLGEEQAHQAIGSLPLLSLVLREVRGEGTLVDPDEGAGFFSVTGFEGVVGLMGVTDERAALDTVVKELEGEGLVATRGEPGQGVLLRQERGQSLLLFADRGYLYLIVPDAPEADKAVTADGTGGAPPAPPAPVDPQVLQGLRARVTGFQGPGLSELPLLTGMRGKVGEGNVYFFARPSKPGTDSIQGFWGAVKFEAAQAALDGWLAWDNALFSGASAPASALLTRAPAGPIAALTVSIPPGELATLAFGAPGSERRERTMGNLREQGLDAAGAEGLVGALRGDVSLLAYFDAPAFYRNFIQGSRKPEPRGTLLFQAGLVRSAPVLEWILGRLKEGGTAYEVAKDGGTTRLTLRAFGQPVEIVVAADGLTLRGGESLQARPQGDVGGALRERFGAQAFLPGHLSLGLDMGRLRTDLDAPQVPGVPEQQLPMARALVGTVLEQLPPIDALFLDFVPDQGGGRLQLRTSLRTR